MKRKLQLPLGIQQELGLVKKQAKKPTQKSTPKPTPKKVIQPEEDPEDGYIRMLEKKLKLKKGKKHQGFIDDGLDFILDAIESDEASVDEGSDGSMESDASSDEEPRKKSIKTVQPTPRPTPKPTPESNAVTSPEPTSQTTEIKENVEKEVKKYVPPQKRNDEQLERLKKLFKGQLNRLSDGNFMSIVNALQEIALSYPRASVTRSLTELILEFIGDHANLQPFFVATYGALIGALHANMGDFSAHFIQTLVETFDQVKSEPGKKGLNLITLLSYLYNFGVISCLFMYDLIRECLQDLTEIKLEFLLKILTISGTTLRSDDPTALKEIIVLAGSSTDDMSARHKFLLDTLTELKHNRRKPFSTSEQESRLKKLFSSKEALRVTLNDIRQIDSKGKWWLVGAAWKGHEVVLPKQENTELYELAKKYKMNTDIRRNIFMVVMSSMDYIDAYERLQKLSLKDKQEREIIRVLMHCCSLEKAYNPYYSLVIELFCHYNFSHKISFQFALWDYLKELKVTRKAHHLAKMTSFLISKNALTLDVLKGLNLTDLTDLQSLFLYIILGSLVFEPKVWDQLKSKQLANGLFIFLKQNMHHFPPDTITDSNFIQACETTLQLLNHERFQ